MTGNDEHKHGKFFYPTDTVEQHWIERARVNVADFIMYMTDGEFTIPDHHLEWLFYLVSKDFKFINLIAFRGSAKTFILVHFLAWFIGRYPHKTNSIFSSNGDLSGARLREVKDMIETNTRYRNVFPHVHIDEKRKNNAKEFTVWSSVKFVHKGGGAVEECTYEEWRRYIEKKGQPRDATLFSVGITASGIAGRRFTGIVLLDDIHDSKNSATPAQRMKIMMNVKGTIMPCMWRHANPKMVSISTRWGEDDFPGMVMEEKRGNGDLVWKTLEVAVMDEDGEPVWKGVWTHEKIEEAREEHGEVMFQLMFMNNPKAAATGEFTLDMFRLDLPEYEVEFDELGVSVDFAHTETSRADYTVFIAYAKSYDKDSAGKKKPFVFYILDVKRFKREQISSKIDELIDFCDHIFGVYGQLDKVLMEKADSQAEYQDIQTKRPDLPTTQIPTKGDKEQRLKLFGTVAQQKRLRCNRAAKDHNAMVSEIIGFPSKNDDFCDAVSLPFQQESWNIARKIRAKIHTIESPYLI